ncbi:DUF4239 domain-containing protein [Kitasatospora sp. NBC_01250]|uniref:bestrophin-like domain n=1 Tax=unclassified Kitasatospora TaxID=2633591 RepID=UPI002E10782D|nr:MULTISPECIES: hypothetical protein [unclassified Kitasatospora]WSJ71396.1 DUF4239 domain-containing protein [Kitasatospora sp. NBC_01302]
MHLLQTAEAATTLSCLAALWLLPASRPVWLATALRIIGIVALADLMVPLGHWLFPRSLASNDNGLMAVILGLVGTLFGLMVAFVVVVVWQSMSDADSVTAREANALADLERVSRGFPVRIRRQVQGAVRTYARLVIHDEWPALAHAGASERAGAALAELWEVYTLMGQPERGDPLYAHSMALLTNLDDCRRQRLLLAAKRIPTALWMLMAADSVIIVAMAQAFGLSGQARDRLVMISIVGTIALVLFLIGELDAAFSGDLKVSPAAFSTVLASLQNLEDY